MSSIKSTAFPASRWSASITFTTWQQRFDNYMLVKKAWGMTEGKICSVLSPCLGSEGPRLFYTLRTRYNIWWNHDCNWKTFYPVTVLGWKDNEITHQYVTIAKWTQVKICTLLSVLNSVPPAPVLTVDGANQSFCKKRGTQIAQTHGHYTQASKI